MDTLIAYGHSWVAGAGATAPARCLAATLARGLGAELVNRAVSGSDSTHAAGLVAASGNGGQNLPTSAVLVMTGLNDARLHGQSQTALATFTTNLTSIVAAYARAAVVILVAQPHLVDYSRFPPHNQGSDAAVDAYNAALRAVAAAGPRAVVAEPNGWDPHTMLDADTVHPNDAGHELLAAAALHAVRG